MDKFNRKDNNSNKNNNENSNMNDENLNMINNENNEEKSSLNINETLENNKQQEEKEEKIKKVQNKKSETSKINKYLKNGKTEGEKRIFKYGGKSSMVTALFIVVAIIINILVGKLNVKKDLTANKMYSISPQTIKVLKSLNKNINIYALYSTGQESPMIKEILNEYKGKSSKVKVIYKDPEKYPQILEKFKKSGEKVGVGSIVVESGSNYKVIDPQSFLNYDYSNPYNPSVKSISIEQNITSAINYVTSKGNEKLYILKGHGEGELSEEILKQMEIDNYELQSIDLSTKESKIEGNSMLFVISPKNDLSDVEVNKVNNYLKNGGKVMYLMDIIQKDMPNFRKLFKEYELDVENIVAVEQNSQHVAQNPLYLLPEQKNHEITKPLIENGIRTLIPGAQAIKIINEKNSNFKISPLLMTTKESFGKKDLQNQTLEKQSGDVSGPFNIAVASENKVNKSKIVVIGNSTFINDQVSSLSRGGNTDFFMNSVGWLLDKDKSISVRPKDMENYIVDISAYHKMLSSGLAVIVIPTIIFVTGIVILNRRRKK